MSEDLRVCADCRYHRTRTPILPFDGIDVWTPDILTLKAEWEKEQAEIALKEQHRFELGDEFDYEPYTLPWCARWTEREGRFVINPVTGKRSPVFAVCARKNADGKCPLFERVR